MNYPEIQSIARNPGLDGMYRVQQVVYSTATGSDLPMTLVLPWTSENQPETKRPLIVFVQGSGWTTPDNGYELPQMVRYAQAGYVVAMVVHRSALDRHRFPAYLCDVKCAIRFLRKNAAVYCVDPERIAIWGTSSGGNTALLVGLTSGDPRYRTDEHAGYSDAVNAVVECFGPTDIPTLFGARDVTPDFEEIFKGLFGDDPERYDEQEKEMSPLYHVEAGKRYPPFLLLHGTGDELVPFQQMTDMYHKLLDCGADARAYQIIDAPHEDSFWSAAVHDIILEFFRAHI